LNVVFLSIILNILSFGITIRVSTACFIFSSQAKAFSNLFLPSKLKGFVTTQTVKIPISFATCAITGAAHVQVPPHIQAVTKSISVSCRYFLISSILSSAAFLPTSGLAQAQSHLVIFSQILTFFSAKLLANACASVFTAIKSIPFNHSETILFNVLAQPHHTPITVILAQGINAGLISFITIFILN